MSDPVPASAVAPVPGDSLPGDVVRALFDRNEQELEALRREFDDACHETEAVEARVRAHPALGLLTPDEVTMLVPPDRGSGLGSPHEAPPPRTTVDRRPRTAEALAAVVEGGAGDGAVGGEAGRTRAGRLVTSHWVWRVGVAVVVVALLLLKFG